MPWNYDHKQVEHNAQEKWVRTSLHETDLNDSEKEPYYLLVEFPYPSGDLHIGHWYAFAVTDIFARYMRMKGKNVLFPFGFDAFGLPAENAAIRNGLDPKEWTYQNIERMRKQMKQMGASYDWSKEIITCEPEYYRWTQWLFSKLFEHGLAERRNAPVKWCPKDMTVLANEQVLDGHCERCGSVVEERNLTQWFLKITQYAKRLLDDLEPLPWREDIKDAQRAWIGESEGAKLSFDVRADGADVGTIEIFTTRPDTIYGATYIVLAPEHPLVASLAPLTWNAPEVEAYQQTTSRKTERERSESKEKTGVLLEGITAVHPATKLEIPVYVADYVLATYGTGAVMAVPAHDERDFEFAQKFNLPIIYVIAPRFIDYKNPHVEGKKIVPRKTVMGIIYNPKSKKYLALKWKTQPWTSFVIGGIEEGETALEAAEREVREETGYKNFKYVRTLGGPTRAEFFAAHKDENRVSYATTILFELEDEEHDELAPEEAAKHELMWLDKNEVTVERMAHAETAHVLERLHGGDMPYTGDGVLINSEEFNGHDNREAMWNIVESIGGKRVTNYRLRDWLVSRQRYWGCPIPIVYDPEGKPHAISAEHLPWLLPTDVDFEPTGKSPLASSKELRERVERIFGEGWTPEYDTLDVFVDSAWYFTRYLAPHADTHFSDEALLKQWMPVNRYAGGAEHTTVHLLYSRFFYKALYDLALVPTPEPYYERFNRGIILGSDGQKMSKRWGNVVNPDEMVERFGADTVRLYLAFIGPYNEAGSYPWNLDGVEAMRRFLERVTKLFERVSDTKPSRELDHALSKAIEKVENDSERFKFNTAISALMILLRELESLPAVPRDTYVDFLKLLAPFAPHLTDYLYAAVTNDVSENSIHAATWPIAAYAGQPEKEVTVVVQLNGKRRGEVMLAPDADEDAALQAANDIPGFADALTKVNVARTVYVPGRILNFVTGP